DNINSMDDIEVGMVMTGIVTNLTKFGAFVDIGIKQDGLVHISQIADKYIKDPADVLKLNQRVQVKVLEIDRERKRIHLSIKHA
ncbi:MAG TPA: S1 RNA-binding domain-containing protein, partial [Saprospiraceae bacterium]|nr:S1 RNA-binding domain-containing protein [Saprospiraceae bacterium]